MQERNSSISNFRLFAVKILLPLLLITGGGGVVFNYFFERYIINNNEVSGAYKVNRILNEERADEIPIFGSSRAEGCILPDSLGSNYFNYGLSGTKYDVTLFFMEEECRKKKSNPRMIINFDLDGVLRGLGDIANYIPNSGNASVRELLGNEYQPFFRVPFIRYYGRFETYFRSYMSGRIELTKVTNKGAALEKNALPKAQFDELVNERRNTNTLFTADSQLKSRLMKLIAAQREREFVFVISPYHSSYFDKYMNLNEAYGFLGELKANANVKVFDFSKMALADSMFLNTSHINYKGAMVFSRTLRDSLKSLEVPKAGG